MAWAQLRNSLGGLCLDDNAGSPFADLYACVPFEAQDAANEDWRVSSTGGLECKARPGRMQIGLISVDVGAVRVTTTTVVSLALHKDSHFRGD